MTHNIVYIAPDEEITSLVARLRESGAAQVTLVFPKRSVITESTINLKLLLREAAKLGAMLTIVSQNENTRIRAEKLGFVTMPYSSEFREPQALKIQPEEMSAEEFVEEQVQADQQLYERQDIPALREEVVKPVAREIGSAGFHVTSSISRSVTTPEVMTPSQAMGDAGIDLEAPNEAMGETASVRVTEPQPPVKTLRVRNASPVRPPGLNSIHTEEREAAQVRNMSGIIAPQPEIERPVSDMVRTPQEPQIIQAVPEGVNASSQEVQREAAIVGSLARPTVASVVPSVRNADQQTRSTSSNLERYFGGTPTSPRHVPEATRTQKKPEPIQTQKKHQLHFSYKWLVGAFGLLVLAALGTVWFLLLLPQATVDVELYTLTESTDKTLTLSSSSTPALITETQEVSVTIPGIATGALTGTDITSSATNQNKTSGTILISNEYSSEAQTLVATTRFEAEDGKIYRIPKAVTVPGNGSVQAEVVADGSGEEYNKESAVFTIPGFKGSDKFAKFSAKTVTALTGGTGDTASTQTTLGVFIVADQETLKSQAMQKAKDDYLASVDEGNVSDTTLLKESIGLEFVSDEGMPKVGSVPTEYDYTARFRLTVHSVNTASLLNALRQDINMEYENVSFQPQDSSLEIVSVSRIPDTNEVEVKAHLDLDMRSVLDEEALKQDLYGVSNSDLPSVLKKHPEVKELSVHFQPSWALQRVPKKSEKIDIHIVNE